MINQQPPQPSHAGHLNESQQGQVPAQETTTRSKDKGTQTSPELRGSAADDDYARPKRERPLHDKMTQTDALAALQRPASTHQQGPPRVPQETRPRIVQETQPVPALAAAIRTDDTQSLSDQEKLRRDGIFTYYELTQKAQSLLPGPQDANVAAKDGVGQSLTVKSSAKVVQIIRSYLSKLGFDAPGSIREVDKRHLDKLWGTEGTNYILFRDMIRELREQPRIHIQWIDSLGVDRTAHLNPKAWVSKKIATVDEQSDSDKLRRTSRAAMRITSGQAAVNPAVALALVCLRNEDHVNFARIVASNPSAMVRDLLDTKVLKLGRMFTDKNIWLLLSYAAPRYVEKGGGMPRELEALTLATSNFLSFHQTDGAHPPVAKLRIKLEDKYRAQLYAHVNAPAELAKSIEQIWEFLCPKVSPATVLHKFEEEAQTEAKIGAFIIKIFFAAVDYTLGEAASSKEKGARKMAVAAETATGALQSAANTSGAADAVSGLLGPVTAQLSGVAVKRLTNINVNSDFRAQQFYYQELYKTLRVNARGSRLVVGQPVLEDGDLASFRAAAPLGVPNPQEVEGKVGSATSRFYALVRQYPDIGDMSSEDRKRVADQRQIFGDMLADALDALDSLNIYKPA